MVDWVEDSAEAGNYFKSQWNDDNLGIFDWLLPSLSGLELLKKLRKYKNALPVLMLTAKDTMEDKVMQLADYY